VAALGILTETLPIENYYLYPPYYITALLSSFNVIQRQRYCIEIGQ